MKYLLPLFLCLVVIVPMQVFALEAPADLVACQDGGKCTFCQLIQTIRNVVNWITAIALSIAVILMIYAGYRITSARGDVSVVTEGRKMIGNVAIGIFIIILALSIVDILMKTVTGGTFGAWNPPSDEKCGIQQDLKDADKYETEKLEMNSGLKIVPSAADGAVEAGYGNAQTGEFGDGSTGKPDPTDTTSSDIGNDYTSPEFGPQ